MNDKDLFARFVYLYKITNGGQDYSQVSPEDQDRFKKALDWWNSLPQDQKNSWNTQHQQYVAQNPQAAQPQNQNQFPQPSGFSSSATGAPLQPAPSAEKSKVEGSRNGESAKAANTAPTAESTDGTKKNMLKDRGWPEGVPVPGSGKKIDPSKITQDQKKKIREFYMSTGGGEAAANAAMRHLGLITPPNTAKAKEDASWNPPHAYKGPELPIGYSNWGEYQQAARDSRKQSQEEYEYKKNMRDISLRQAHRQEAASLIAAREELSKNPHAHWQQMADYGRQLDQLNATQRGYQIIPSSHQPNLYGPTPGAGGYGGYGGYGDNSFTPNMSGQFSTTTGSPVTSANQGNYNGF